jgi:hypothetical protein
MLRGCPISRASSIFGAILADFRVFIWGEYSIREIKEPETRLKRAQKATTPTY